MRDAWADDIRERAAAWWTPKRIRDLLGDKQYILTPMAAPVLLRALGLLELDGSIHPSRMRKYRQTNHMLAVLRPSLQELVDAYDEVCLVDAGCGRSYLTMIVAWWFEEVARHPVRILGIDRTPVVIESSRRRAEAAGLRSLRFIAADLAEVDLSAELPAVHGVVSLHACDTATDDALVLAVAHGARFIAVAPCCQAELSSAWATRAREVPDHPMAALWASPHQRRTAAATLTDTMRQHLLMAWGYDAVAMEFVEAVHTPKNTLIRAIRRAERDPAAMARYLALKEATGGVGIALESRLAALSGGGTPRAS